MKKQFYLLILAIIGTACQQQKPTTITAAPVIAEMATSSSKSAVVPAITPVAATDLLTPEMRAMLRRVDLSPLFLAPESQAAGYKTALDGFFGTKPQRVSLAILQASRDSLRPELIHVVGKARYQKQVTNFSGDICLTSLTDYYDQRFLASQSEDGFIQDTSARGGGAITNAKAYSASATFHFVGNVPAEYAVTGKALLDFWLMDNGKVGTMYTPGQGIVLQEAPTKGSGLVLEGNWQDSGIKTGRPFAVSSNIFLLSPGLIKDFGIGERSSQVNPKYAKQGWSNYWENDEWWADSPKPSLNL